MTSTSSSARPSPVAAALIMLVLAIALAWLPLLGPLIAGYAGGRKAGSTNTALILALLPAVLLTALIVVVLNAFDLPILGAVAGVGIFIAVLVQDIPLLVGAYLGAVA